MLDWNKSAVGLFLHFSFLYLLLFFLCRTIEIVIVQGLEFCGRLKLQRWNSGVKKVQSRHLLYFAFCQCQIAAGVARNSSNSKTDLRISKMVSSNWRVCPGLGQPSKVYKHWLRTLLKEDSRQTIRELGEKMYCSHTASDRRHRSAGFDKIRTLNVHELNEHQKGKRFFTVSQHFVGNY